MYCILFTDPPVFSIPGGGKGEFLDVWAEQNGAHMWLRDRASNQVTLVHLSAHGANVTKPKSQRSGYGHAMRIDLETRIPGGWDDIKYIISLPSAAILLQWLEWLGKFAGSGCAVTAMSERRQLQAALVIQVHWHSALPCKYSALPCKYSALPPRCTGASSLTGVRRRCS